MGAVAFQLSPGYDRTEQQRYCAKCKTLVEYTEQDWVDKGRKGWKQFCKVCGTCVGMRYDLSDLPAVGLPIDIYAYKDRYYRRFR